MDLQIKGADQLGALARDLRAAGDKELKRELYRALNRATKPLRAEAQGRAAADLPQENGLAKLVSKKKGTVRIRAGRDPRLTITFGAKAASTDRGFVYHRVFGKGPLVRQEVDGAGWFSETMRNGAPTVRKEIIQAMSDVADQIKRS